MLPSGHFYFGALPGSAAEKFLHTSCGEHGCVSAQGCTWRDVGGKHLFRFCQRRPIIFSMLVPSDTAAASRSPGLRSGGWPTGLAHTPLPRPTLVTACQPSGSIYPMEAADTGSQGSLPWRTGALTSASLCVLASPGVLCLFLLATGFLP